MVTPAADTTRAPHVLDPGPHWTSRAKALAWTSGLVAISMLEHHPVPGWQTLVDVYDSMLDAHEQHRRDLAYIDLCCPWRPPGTTRETKT